MEDVPIDLDLVSHLWEMDVNQNGVHLSGVLLLNGVLLNGVLQNASVI